MRAEAVGDGGERAEITELRPLREDGALAAGLDLAENQRIGALAEIDPLDVVRVGRDVPTKVVSADIVGLAQTAERKVALLIIVFHRGRRVDVRDELRGLIGRVEAQILDEVGGDGIDVHGHVLQRLLRARGRERVVRGPAAVLIFRQDERREFDDVRLRGFVGSGGRTDGLGVEREGAREKGSAEQARRSLGVRGVQWHGRRGSTGFPARREGEGSPPAWESGRSGQRRNDLYR